MTTTDPRLDTRLAEANAAVHKEVERSEPKAGAVLTAFSLPLAVLVATVPGRTLPPAVALLATVGAIGLAAAVIAVLFTIRPRITGAPPRYLSLLGHPRPGQPSGPARRPP